MSFGLVLATSLTATAAPAKKLCNLLVDETGDWKGGTYSSQGSNALDVLTADIATGKTELVATVRVPTTSIENDNWRKLGGYGWMFKANLGGVDYQFEYGMSSMIAGDKKTSAVTVGNTQPKHTVTVEAKAITWRVKRAELPSLNRKPGQVFTALAASSKSWGGTADTAVAAPGTKYPDKAPSCLVAK